MSEIRDYIINNFDGLLMLPEQFDDCIIGMAERCSFTVVAYDADKIVQKIMEDSKCDYDEALDIYGHDFIGFYHGETTPVFVSGVNNFTL